MADDTTRLANELLDLTEQATIARQTAGNRGLLTTRGAREEAIIDTMAPVSGRMLNDEAVGALVAIYDISSYDDDEVFAEV